MLSVMRGLASTFRSPYARRLGGAVALLLLGLAIYFAAKDADWSVLGRASPVEVIALLGLVAANVVLSALLLWAVTRTFDADPPVTALRMTELVAVSALLNYVPFVRAGLVGRTAYLHAAHRLSLTQQWATLAIVSILAVLVAAATLLALLPAPIDLAMLLGAFALLTCLAPLARLTLRRPVRLWATWVPLRALDVLASAARLWLAFRIVGQPIAVDAALVTGSAALLVRLAGVTPNGLGLSEWTVAALSSALSPATAAAGAAAALVDRAAEVLVVTLTGSVAAWRLRHVLRAARNDNA